MIGVDIDAIETAENREKFQSPDGKVRRRSMYRTYSYLLHAGLKKMSEGFPLVHQAVLHIWEDRRGICRWPGYFEKPWVPDIRPLPPMRCLLSKYLRLEGYMNCEYCGDISGNIGLFIPVLLKTRSMGVHRGISIYVTPAMRFPITVYMRMRTWPFAMMNGMRGFLPADVMCQFGVANHYWSRYKSGYHAHSAWL